MMTAAVSAPAVAAARKSSAVFAAPFVAGVAYVASPVPRFVRVEVTERLLPSLWHRSPVTMMRIVTVIDVAVEAVRAMKPRASPYEDATTEPVRPIVAIRSTRIRGVVKIPVRANRRDSNVDGNLSRCYGHTTHHPNSESTKSKRLPSGHSSS
jgi:hypothetical protein